MVKLFTHTDLDGVGCAVLAKFAFGNDVDIEYCNYDDIDSKVEDYDYAIFHQPNGKFYLRAAKKLGFTPEQYKDGLLTPNVGNTYSGAVPLALSNVLDKAEPGDKIFIVSYGSGAGSDGFTLTVNDRIEEVKNQRRTKRQN